MMQTDAQQQLVLSLLRDVLSQRGDKMPHVQLQRYQFALRRLVYDCPRTQDGYQTSYAYYVLVQAMHAIYRQKESDAAPWLALVEEATYDAFLRLQKL